MQRSIFMLCLALIMTVSVFALDKTELESKIDECNANKATAHEAAELMRSKGYPEDNIIIRTASDWWWSEEYKVRDYKEQIEAIEQEEAAQVQNSIYLYDLNCADPGYSGHPVTLTDSQQEKVLRACVGEQGMDDTYETYVGMLQYIVDYVEYGSLPRTYKNIGYYWLTSAYGAKASKYTLPEIKQNAALMEAYDFVINQGGRLFQHKMGGYWDDDDAAGWDSFSTNVKNTCGGGHDHEWITCVNPNEENEWVRFWVCTNKYV